MFSILLTPLLMLLSVFGLYSPQRQPLPTRPSEIARPATPKSAEATTTPAKLAVVAVATQEEVTEKRPEPKVPAASAPMPTPDATPQPVETPSIDFASDTESRILSLMNIERAAEGLGVLTTDTQLAKLARAHSADMLARGYFDHQDPDGCSSSCRADEAGYAWMAIGENIYMTDGYELSANKEAALVVDGWMRSQGHRANILGAKFTHAGVGVAVKGEQVYITAVYAKPR